MAYKNYKIRDNWLDINKYNDVDVQSVDGVIQNVKVNGEDVGGGGSGDFTIKTIVKNITTEQIITSPDLYVEAQPAFNVDIVDGDDPHIFVMEGEGTVSLCYKDYETSSFIDTVTLKTNYPLKLQRFVAMLGEDELHIDSGEFNGTPVDPINGFYIENDGTLILLVEMIH